MFDYIRKNKILLFIMTAGFLFLMLTILPSGSNLCYQKQCGIFFWGANGHDGIWHLSLISAAFKQMPFILPVYAGARLTGYNFLMDFVLYLLTFLRFSPAFLYFKFLPLVWFFLFVTFTFKLGRKIIDSASYISWLFFFMFFASAFTFVFPLYHKGSIWGASSLLSMQSGQTLTNMPFALSLIILLPLFLILKQKKHSVVSHLIIGLFVFINFGLKFYAGFVSLVLVGAFYFFEYISSKDRFQVNKIVKTIGCVSFILLCTLLAIIIFYDPFSSLETGSIFVFSPFSTMHAVIEEPVLLYMRDMVNARYYLYSHGIGPRLIFIEAFSALIFLFFSMGLRIFGVLYIVYKVIKKKAGVFDISLITTAIASYIFLLLFVQKGEWWNVIQFYYYTLFILNIFTAEFFYEIVSHAKKRSIQISIISIVVLLSLPGNLDILRSFISYPGHTYIPKEELQALSFLQKQPKGTVLALAPDNKNMSVKGIRPLYLAEDSAYVSAFSSHQTYLNDFDQLNITGIDYKERLRKIKNNDCDILKEVDYVYLLKRANNNFYSACLKDSGKMHQQIFNNNDVLIIRIYNLSSKNNR